MQVPHRCCYTVLTRPNGCIGRSGLFSLFFLVCFSHFSIFPFFFSFFSQFLEFLGFSLFFFQFFSFSFFQFFSGFVFSFTIFFLFLSWFGSMDTVMLVMLKRTWNRSLPKAESRRILIGDQGPCGLQSKLLVSSLRDTMMMPCWEARWIKTFHWRLAEGSAFKDTVMLVMLKSTWRNHTERCGYLTLTF